MEKTAVNWFYNELKKLIKESELTDMKPSEFDIKETRLLKQANEMEKQQQNKFNQQLEMLNKSWKEYCKANFKSE